MATCVDVCVCVWCVPCVSSSADPIDCIHVDTQGKTVSQRGAQVNRRAHGGTEETTHEWCTTHTKATKGVLVDEWFGMCVPRVGAFRRSHNFTLDDDERRDGHGRMVRQALDRLPLSPPACLSVCVCCYLLSLCVVLFSVSFPFPFRLFVGRQVALDRFPSASVATSPTNDNNKKQSNQQQR